VKISGKTTWRNEGRKRKILSQPQREEKRIGINEEERENRRIHPSRFEK